MPLGPATFITRASGGIEASLQCFPFTAAASVHTLAVEVHQGGTTTSDGLFGAEIRAVTLPPALGISRDAGGNILVRSGADSSWQLMNSGAAAAGYAPVAGNPLGTHVVAPPAQLPAEFFHLQYRASP